MKRLRVIDAIRKACPDVTWRYSWDIGGRWIGGDGSVIYATFSADDPEGPRSYWRYFDNKPPEHVNIAVMLDVARRVNSMSSTVEGRKMLKCYAKPINPTYHSDTVTLKGTDA